MRRSANGHELPITPSTDHHSSRHEHACPISAKTGAGPAKRSPGAPGRARAHAPPAGGNRSAKRGTGPAAQLGAPRIEQPPAGRGGAGRVARAAATVGGGRRPGVVGLVPGLAPGFHDGALGRDDRRCGDGRLLERQCLARAHPSGRPARGAGGGRGLGAGTHAAAGPGTPRPRRRGLDLGGKPWHRSGARRPGGALCA